METPPVTAESATIEGGHIRFDGGVAVGLATLPRTARFAVRNLVIVVADTKTSTASLAKFLEKLCRFPESIVVTGNVSVEWISRAQMPLCEYFNGDPNAGSDADRNTNGDIGANYGEFYGRMLREIYASANT